MCLYLIAEFMMRRPLQMTIFFIAFISFANAKDCSTSKKFTLHHPQRLSGVFADPNGAYLPGIKIQLLSGRKVIHDIRTQNDGGYDLGDVPAGTYRIRIKHRPFCAPKVQCERNECIIEQRLEINPEHTVTVR
jgi:carboxypeptidase family protein